MAVESRFKERCKVGDTPWDIGKPNPNLIQAISSIPIKPCKAIEIGCETGDNAIWLPQQNFHVLGIDSSEIAIEKAKEKASRANAKCAFLVSDILTPKLWDMLRRGGEAYGDDGKHRISQLQAGSVGTNRY